MDPQEGDLPPDKGDQTERGLRRLWIEVRDFSSDPITEDAALETDEVDSQLLNQTRDCARQVAEGVFWIAVMRDRETSNVKPATIEDVLPSPETSDRPRPSDAEPGSSQLALLTEGGQSIPFRFEKSDAEQNQWQLVAEWPDSRRPFQICVLEFSAPQRAVGRAILGQVSGPLTLPRATSRAEERFPLALESPASPGTGGPPSREGFGITLSDKCDEIVVSAQRLPSDRDYLPVRIQLGTGELQKTRLIVLEWVPHRNAFLGAITTEAEQFRAGSIRCEVRELRWDDIPTLSPAQFNLAIGDRRQIVLPFVSDELCQSVQFDDWHRTNLADFPHSIWGVRIAQLEGSGRFAHA